MTWELLFNGWSAVGRTVVVGVLAYAAVLVLLRSSGKRTLSKMNAFDFVVTVALGSTLATVLVSQSVSLAQGVTAFAVLIGLQFLITWLSVRSRLVSRLVKAEPVLLYRGGFLHQRMRRERVVEDEVMAAIRDNGVTRFDEVEAVVLETDGTFSVLTSAGSGQRTYADLPGVGEPEGR